MAFSRGQVATAWTCFTIMGGMLLYPPWFWQGDTDVVSSAQFDAGYDWLWSPPLSTAEPGWMPVIWWQRLRGQWLIIAIGMLILLFLREARERTNGLGRAAPVPSSEP